MLVPASFLAFSILPIVVACAYQRSRVTRPPTAPPSSADPIDAFWLWWETVKVPLANAIEARTLSEWTEPISDRVHAIHPSLAWELGPGVKSAHHLCVSAEGDARLRVTTERWLSRAPAPDALWEFYPARQASPRDRKLTLRLGEVEIAYDDVRLGLTVDPTRERVHVVIYHPAFAQLAEGPRSTATFLLLDDALGEDGVERWIGHVRHTLDASEATQPRTALFEATDALRQAHGEETFSLLEMQDAEGNRKIAVLNFGLKRLDHLLMESHVSVNIAYPAGANGFYSESVGDEVNAMEDVLLEALEKHAVYIGHETGLGRRVIHLHVAPGGPAQRIIADWERMYPTWEIETVAEADPQWDVLKRW